MLIPRPTRGGLLFLCAAAAALGTAFMNVGLVSALIASVISAFVLSGFLLCWFTAAGLNSAARSCRKAGVWKRSPCRWWSGTALSFSVSPR
ncbi:MAG: hypothetical protein IJH79_11450 [Lentisphaeria bacterium]|nr:hypothetical protein [Lentisphaeria bacterium]